MAKDSDPARANDPPDDPFPQGSLPEDPEEFRVVGIGASMKKRICHPFDRHLLDARPAYDTCYSTHRK